MNEIRLDYSAISRLREQFAAAPSVVEHELVSAVTEADNLIERETREAYGTAPIKASGHTGDSITSVQRVNGLQVEGFVGSSIAHIVPVELGTRPHFPPVEALVDWVRTKLNIQNEKVARGVAFLVARKIARTGTKGAHVFETVLARLEPQITQIFAAAQLRILDRVSGGRLA